MCRYPHLFGAAICMSGTYNVERFYEGEFNDQLYLSSPVHFLPGLEGPQLDTLRSRFAILASGEGAWENIGESWHAAAGAGQQGRAQPGRLLGRGVGARLGHLARDAPALPGRALLTATRRLADRRSPR